MTNDDDDRWLTEAQRMLAGVDRAEALDLVAIAGQMDSSYANFRKKFSAMAGMAPARFHAGLLMRRACQIMQCQRITNRELADRLGYSSEYHLSRRFHKIVGVTPRMFRKNLMQQRAD